METETGGKTLFPAHLSQAEVNRGVKAGKLLQGTFYQSRTNFLEGSFNCDSLGKPVLIQGKLQVPRHFI
jgi:exosome complex exonuclease DIS3/RRP44